MRLFWILRYRLAAFAAVSILFSASGVGASFDCTKAASRVERLICSNQELSRLDEELAGEYKKSLDWAADFDERLRAKNPKEAVGASQVRKRQREWLSLERNSCANEICLKAEYESRILDFKKSVRNNDGKSFASLPAGTQSIPPRMFGEYTKEGTVQDFLEITASSDGKAKISLSLLFANGHLCAMEGVAQWRENHLVLHKKSEDSRPCALRIYSDGSLVLLRDPGASCTMWSCGARGWIDGSTLRKNAP